jgi:hypothetical protein
MTNLKSWQLKWLQCCTSIQQTALSLKVLCPFEEIDVAIQKERLIGNELDRQIQEYTYFLDDHESSGTEEECKIKGSKEKETSLLCTEMDLEKLQAQILDQTWNLFIQQSLWDRTRMSFSAQAALNHYCLSNDSRNLDGEDPPHIWTKEVLPIRDELADNVTKLENESRQLQNELAQVIQLCRSIQSSCRTIWCQLQYQLQQKNQALADSNFDQKCLRQKNHVLSCILADVIVGTDLLYSHPDQVSKIFLKVKR